MRLTPAFSGYLDFLRFFAALAVLLGHMMQHGYDVAWIPLAHLSHEAVVIFFVMSGLIIASVTSQSRKTWRDYFIARSARIYSVALPTIVFSLVLSAAIVVAAPAWASQLTLFRAPNWTDLGASLLFLNESWFITFSTPPRLSMNYPYWSLCYEVWYYILFGALFFTEGRTRWCLLIVLSIAAGPAVMVMFPIWWMGARLGLSQARPVRPLGWLALGLSAAPVAFFAIELTSVDMHIREWIKVHFPPWWHLGSSQRVVTDLALGALVTWHLASFQHLPESAVAVFARIARVAAIGAGFSFTLYMFHMPLLTVAGAATPAAWKGPLASIAWAALFVGMCWLISLGTERQLPRWRRAFARLLSPPRTADLRG
jgi:peptidoglycan/LPS O-acetylase OafA/YrhL